MLRNTEKLGLVVAEAVDSQALTCFANGRLSLAVLIGSPPFKASFGERRRKWSMDERLAVT
jgi:hypothetical protein